MDTSSHTAALATPHNLDSWTDDAGDDAFGMEAALPYLMAELSADTSAPAAVL